MTRLKALPDPLDLGNLGATYSVVREVGRGGMGVVVLARHRSAGHQVAIKIASTNQLDDEALARFSLEARLMARFRHPNIVRLYDVHQLSADRIAIVMEYVRGTSLARLIAARRPIPFDTCRQILRDLGAALSHAHANGVVHRDVKPHNVIIEQGTGRAMLSDFGIAKAAAEDSDVTAVGGTLGTPAYMSPEQIDGLTVDNRSDIYGLGMLGWEVISGERPWAGEPLFTVLFKQKHEALPSLTIIRPETPNALLLALEGALAKAPAHRWKSVEEMVEQLGTNEPTSATLARRVRVAAGRHAPAPDVSADSATVPFSRFDRRPTALGSGAAQDVRAESADTARAEARRLGAAATASDAPAVVAVASNGVGARLLLRVLPDGVGASVVDRVARWRQPVLFAFGLMAGGLLMLVALRFSGPERDVPSSMVRVAAAPAEAKLAKGTETRSRSVTTVATPPRATPVIALGAPTTRQVSPAVGASQRPKNGVAASASPPARGFRSLSASSSGPLPAGLLERRTSASALSERARTLVYEGRVDLARRVVDSALRLDSRNGPAYMVRARARIRQGEVRAAWTDIELGERSGARWEALALTTGLRVGEVGRAEALAGLRSELRSALTPRRPLDAERAVAIATALVLVGDHATAITLLELAGPLDQRLLRLLADPLLAPLRPNERFQRLRARAAG